MSDSKTINDGKTETTWRDKTLKAAGYGYLVGDAAFAASGLIKGSTGRDILAAGAIWGAGGIGAAVYGNPDVDKQLEILAHKLENHLVRKGVRITDAERNSTALLRGKNGIGAKLDRFMHEHPTELLNTAYAVGAAGLLWDGAKNFSSKKVTAGMGALVLAGALCGLLIKEDPDARSKVDQSSLVSRVVGYIKEQPMRLSGAFYWANNGLGIMNAISDINDFGNKPRAGMKAHWFSFLMVSSYILSNGLLALSPRNQISGKGFAADDMTKLEHAAASIIAAQPPQVQQAVLADISEFMATQKGVNLKAPEIAQHLAARVTELTGDRMHLAAAKVGHAAKEQARRDVPSMQSVARS